MGTNPGSAINGGAKMGRGQRLRDPIFNGSDIVDELAEMRLAVKTTVSESDLLAFARFERLEKSAWHKAASQANRVADVASERMAVVRLPSGRRSGHSSTS
eukprot:gene27544-8798_t